MAVSPPLPILQPVAPLQRRVVTGWLALALSAMGVAVTFAVLLVAARAPWLYPLFELEHLFGRALVLHVVFSVVVWLMAFAATLWAGALRRTHPLWDGLALGLAVVGAAIMVLRPLATPVAPVLSNYIPVMDDPGFLAGLIIFAAGPALLALRLLGETLRQRSTDLVRLGLSLAAAAYLVALVAFARDAGALAAVAGPARFELMFWGGGHLMQFVFLLLLLTGWAWLLGERHGAPPWGRTALGLAFVPVLAGALLPWWFSPLDPGQRDAYTELMRYGSLLALLLPLAALLRQPGRHRAVHLPLALLLFGLALGLSLRGDDVAVAAHYHAVNAALTLTFMQLSWRLLAAWGNPVPAALVRGQAWLYTVAMVLYVSGLAGAGWLAVPRKTAGLAQGIEALGAQTAMGLVAVGGLLAIGASVGFLAIALAAWRSRSHPVAERACEGTQ